MPPTTPSRIGGLSRPEVAAPYDRADVISNFTAHWVWK
jgi:hypothetical protein